MTLDSNKHPPSSKPDKNLKDAPMPPLPFARHIGKKEVEISKNENIEDILGKEGPLTVDEAALLLADLRKKQDALRNQLDEMFEKRGVTPRYLRKFMKDPNNFAPQELENLKKDSQAFLDSLNIPPDILEVPPTTSDTSKTEPKSQIPKDQRGKKPGIAHRRGWLPMR